MINVKHPNRRTPIVIHIVLKTTDCDSRNVSLRRSRRMSENPKISDGSLMNHTIFSIFKVTIIDNDEVMVSTVTIKCGIVPGIEPKF